MSETLNVDVAIIGAGTAGLNARREAVKVTDSVVMIEGGAYGTTCARVGCMPSKLLIAAADAAHHMRTADLFGIRCEPEIDPRRVMERVRNERDRFVGFVVAAVEDYPEEQRIRGWARFVSNSQLVVAREEGGELVVNAKSIVIAVGSSPWHPPVLDGAGDRLLINDQIFEFDTLPGSIAVVGTGVIGLELGQALNRLGVRTALFSNRDILGPVSDHVIQQKTRQVFGEELDLRLNTGISHVARTEQGVVMTWTDTDGSIHSEEFEYVLAATGRRANLGKLGLENTDLALDARGIPTFDGRTMQCCDLPIFIAGDVTNDRPLLHEASDEGHTAGENAAKFPQVIAHRRRTPMGVVFSDPQLAHVGRGYQELVDSGDEFGAGEVSYDDQGRARVMGLNQGHVRIYASRACGTLVGAEMFGPRVEHTAHLLAWAIQARMTVVEALAMPFYHPVIEEGIRTALRDLAANLKMDGASDPLADGPGN